MMNSILGLDIGGANLKVATPQKQAISVAFALWKQPDKLSSALANLIGKFPETEELAITMTGELCDCYETKRDGVNAIIAATRAISQGRRIRIWSTDGVFLDSEAAKANHLKVASANWHALATLAGHYVPTGPATLIDIGSTTTDIIPILDGRPIPQGRTDPERMVSGELVYMGIRRTPVMALMGVAEKLAAEVFATTLDVYLHAGLIAEDPSDTDTADGRPATRAYAFDRLCRMYCGDRETVSRDLIDALANNVLDRQIRLILTAFERAWWPIEREVLSQGRNPQKERSRTLLITGCGEVLLPRLLDSLGQCHDILSLSDQLGPEVSSCAPAYAVAVLAAESRR